MAGISFFQCIKKICGILIAIVALYAPLMSQAHAADVVTTYKDENGWRLKVNGEDFLCQRCRLGLLAEESELHL